jgi:hypothetical protein
MFSKRDAVVLVLVVAAGTVQVSAQSPAQDSTIDAELDKRQAEIHAAVDRMVAGADVQAVMADLIAAFPDDYRDSVISRVRGRLQVLNEEYSRRRLEQERRAKLGAIIDGELFNLSAAVLLMNPGAYESITDKLRRKPVLEARVLEIGDTLLRHKAKPDMQMVKRLKKIYQRALELQKQRALHDRETQ